VFGEPDDHYVIGPKRRFEWRARWDLRKATKYIELHAVFSRRQTWVKRTHIARVVRIGAHWTALYVHAEKPDEIAEGLTSILDFHAINPRHAIPVADMALIAGVRNGAGYTSVGAGGGSLNPAR
jgi:hypothetical protein